MAKTKIVDKNALSQYTEEMKGYIKSQGLGLTEEDINGLIDIKLVPVNETIEDKVDKVDGMGLSANDYSNEDKSKVDSIPSDAKFTDTVYDDTELSGRIDDLETAVNDTLTNAKEYTDEKVSNLASTTIVDNKVSTHNISNSAHSDIRALISDLSTKVNNFLDVDDTTTDQLSEVITLIENNKGTLESLTTNKINVSDIIDNLITASADKVLSANQGVIIKNLIDALQIAVDGKADSNHNHDDKYDTLGSANEALNSAKSYTDTKIDELPDYVAESKEYTDSVVDEKADLEHGHTIADIEGLQTALDNKSDSTHKHDSLYDAKGSANTALNSAKEYVDTVASGKSDVDHNHDSKYDSKGAADTALDSAKEYTDTKTANLASTSTVDTKISTHNTSTSAHNDIRVLIEELTTRLNALANSTDEDLDQMAEIVAYIKSNKSLIDSITTSKINVSDIVDNLTTSSTSKVLSAKQGVAIKALIDALESELDYHTHAIADVSGLQSALDSKASTSHGTHVSYSSTTPVMDGTASVGSANTVARSDHKHPTDTSRASVSDLSTHTGNTTIHITSTERTNWNDANSKKHSHSNKSVLDATTASFTIAEKEKLGAIGSITTTQIDALFA